MNDEMLMLQRKLEVHIDAYEKHVEEDHRRWDRFIATQEEHSKSLDDLTRSLDTAVKSMEGLLTAWQAANGAIKVGATVTRFLRWLSGFAVIGAAAAYVLSKIQ